MRAQNHAIWAKGALVCLFASTAFAQTPPTFPRPMGAGSFPITFATASVWFAHKANSEQKLVTIIVYLNGSAGWNREATDFKWQVNGDPATIAMSVAATKISVTYAGSTGAVGIQGLKYTLSTSNVFVVEGIDSPQPRIRPLGIHDLSFAPDDVPALALLRRDAEVWAAVSGRASEEHPKNSGAHVADRLVAWDAEGLRLLLTEKPEAEKQGCELFRRAALEGYAGSQYRLGYCYESGHGEEQSFTSANEWYEKAANQGHVDAQYKLGHSFRVGRGTPINLPVALGWYKKAAANGDPDALNNVGWMYATGQGVEASSPEAYRWFVEAGKHGDTGSQFEVSRRLRVGDGVAQDLVSAYSWLLVLQVQKSDFAADDWKEIEPAIEAVASKLDRAAIAKAQSEAHDLLAAISRNQMDSFARQR